MWDYAFAYAMEAGAVIPLAQEAAPSQPSFAPGLLFMVAIFAVMWMFLILPNQRRDKERRTMLASLSKGDRVITNGGIVGTIVGLNEKTVVLRVSDEPPTKIEFLRGAVSQIASREGESETKK